MSLDRSFGAADQAWATWRRFSAVLLAALLANSCGPTSPNPAQDTGASRIPPSLAPRFWPPTGWAWGRLASGKDRTVRYGVAAPAGVARAEIVVASGYAEPIEAWFETVSELNGRGYAVWVVEGGATGIDAVLTMAHRAAPSAPVGLLADTDAARAATRVASRWPTLAGLVLSSPDFDQHESFGPAWTRQALDARQRGLTHDRWRGAVVKAWQSANPDLRRPLRLETADKSSETIPPLSAPTLVVSAKPIAGEAQVLCQRAARCEERNFPAGARDLHMETDPVRREWLAAVEHGLGVAPGASSGPEREAAPAGPRDHGL